jgi:hypothetical protein
MQTIERECKRLAERISTNDGRTISDDDSETITAMYCLWSIRSHHRNSPLQDQFIEGVSVLDSEMSKDDMEKLEVSGISSIRPDISIPGRPLAGATIIRNLSAERYRLKGTKWLLLESYSDEFIVPDQSLSRMILPLSPTLCFVYESEVAVLHGDLNVFDVNQLIIVQSLEYYFGRNLFEVE